MTGAAHRARIAAAFAAIALAAAAAPAVADTARDAAFLSSCMDVHLEHGTARTEAACIGILSTPCRNAPEGETTLGISQCLMRETTAWDLLLNEDWPRLRTRAAELGEGADGTPVADTLLAAQRAWIAFRDAECAYAYALWGDGSMRRIAGADCRLHHTARRAIQFRAQLMER